MLRQYSTFKHTRRIVNRMSPSGGAGPTGCPGNNKNLQSEWLIVICFLSAVHTGDIYLLGRGGVLQKNRKDVGGFFCICLNCHPGASLYTPAQQEDHFKTRKKRSPT
jgi:hypothetical protein